MHTAWTVSGLTDGKVSHQTDKTMKCRFPPWLFSSFSSNGFFESLAVCHPQDLFHRGLLDVDVPAENHSDKHLTLSLSLCVRCSSDRKLNVVSVFFTLSLRFVQCKPRTPPLHFSKQQQQKKSHWEVSCHSIELQLLSNTVLPVHLAESQWSLPWLQVNCSCNENIGKLAYFPKQPKVTVETTCTPWAL